MLRLEDSYVFFLMGSGHRTAFVGLRVLRALKARSLLGGQRFSWATLKRARAPDRQRRSRPGWAIAGTAGPNRVAARPSAS